MEMFKSVRSCFVHRSWDAASEQAIYSASHVERATVVCFFDDQAMEVEYNAS